MLEQPPPADAIVVDEDARAVHGLWLFLILLTVGGWWAMFAFVEITGENRIAMHVVGGGMTTAFAAGWIHGARHPARLEISRDVIVEKRRGGKRPITIERTTGDLEFGVRSMVIGGRGSVTPILINPDDPKTEIAIATYDRQKLRQACEAVGWRFRTAAEDPGSLSGQRDSTPPS